MKSLRWCAGFVAVSVAAGLGWLVAQSPSAVKPFVSEDPSYRALDANLYMQTSAEYRAACYQAYTLAEMRLKESLTEKHAKPVAVVLDLDETVFDNGGFQAAQIRSNLAYDQRLWDLWEEKHGDQVGLLPGAKEFLLNAKKLGVTPIYITNRNEKFRDTTKKILARHGLAINQEAELRLSTTTSNKTQRRAETEAIYDVVLYLGDNLRDFDEAFKCPELGKKTPDDLEQAIVARKNTVDLKRAEFGKKFIIFPNPAYGEWLKPLGNGKADLDRLLPEPRQ
ncbi:MAG: 5'-nucleotidase, lipoprotein e(P4) family [Fimbriiglobus sp.]